MADNAKDNPMFDMFRNFGQNLNLPRPDIEATMDFHRRNLQAWQQAVQVSSAGAQKAMDRQREQLQETMQEMADLVQGMSRGDASKTMRDQMEFARHSFEQAMRNTAEMGEIARDSGAESFEILRKRMEESMQEIRDAMSGKK